MALRIMKILDSLFACHAGNTTGMTGNTTHWSLAIPQQRNCLCDSTSRVESHPDKDRESIFESKIRRANYQDLKY